MITIIVATTLTMFVPANIQQNGRGLRIESIQQKTEMIQTIVVAERNCSKQYLDKLKANIESTKVAKVLSIECQ